MSENRDRLDAIAARWSALPPGPWFLATGCSWRRILGGIRRDLKVIVPTTHWRDGQPDLLAGEGVLEAVTPAREDVPWMAAELRRVWAEASRLRTGYLIPSPRAKGPRYRQPRARDVTRAWERAGVSKRIWKQSPHHAFHKGFKSEMLRAGAPAEAVDFLQGHVPRGGRGRYIDMERAFDWDEVLGLVPGLSTDLVLRRSAPAK